MHICFLLSVECFSICRQPPRCHFSQLYIALSKKQGVFLKVSTYPLSKLSFSLNKLFHSWESSRLSQHFPRDSFVQLPNFTVDFCWLKTPTTKNLENTNSLSLNPHHNLVFLCHIIFLLAVNKLNITVLTVIWRFVLPFQILSFRFVWFMW